MNHVNDEVEQARKGLLAVGAEVPVLLRERDRSGNVAGVRIYFGCSSDWCWVYQEALEGQGPVRTSIEIDAREAAEEMFAAYLSSIIERQQLIDPSPLSAQLCELSPRVELVVEDLRSEFDLEVDAWGDQAHRATPSP